MARAPQEKSTGPTPPQRDTSVVPYVAVRASAGTGKTHALTTRTIRLLADGVAVDDLFAATFARKAAGEILARVLHRLAAAAAPDAPAATQALALAIERPTADALFFRDLLVGVTESLDRLSVGTLDSFFVTCADAARFEIGLPAGWTIGTEAELADQRRRAIHQTISTALVPLASSSSSSSSAVTPAALMATLMVQLSGGATTTGLERALEDIVADLSGIRRHTEAAAWDWLTVPRIPPPADIAAAVDTILSAPITDSRIAKSRDEGLAAFTGTRWKEFVSKGIASKVLLGATTYYNKPIDPGLCAAFGTLLEVARSVILQRTVLQTRAIRDLLTSYADTTDQLVAAEGIVSFDDVTRLVGEAAGDGTLDSSRWRGIRFAKHLLLDEFQDTSLGQWRVLERLAEHTITSLGTFYAVGDRKQAIYGWRGGEAELIDSLKSFFDRGPTPLVAADLAESYRSSPAVLDAVNEVFQRLAGCEALEDFDALAARWAATFPPHSAAQPKQSLPGWVRLRTAPEPTEEQSASDALLGYAASRAAALSRANPGKRVGVLVRTNLAAERLIARLKGREKIVASAEGGQPLADSPAVELLLSVLHLVDHPADSVARFHLGTSPLAETLSLSAAAALAPELSPEFLATLDLLRRQLIDEGYGPVLGRLADILAAQASQRDRRRLEQFVAAAHAWDVAGGATREGLARTDPFSAHCRSAAVADPVPSPIRVMTIHKAKGLEFDLVVLTDLDRRFVPRPPRLVVERTGPLEAISRVLAAVPQEFQPFLPADWQQASAQVSHGAVQEAIATLYVGMTRAIQGLEIVINPASPSEKTFPKTLAGVLRGTLPDAPAAPPDMILYSHGHLADATSDALPAEAGRAQKKSPPKAPATPPPTGPIHLQPLPAGQRRRAAPLRTPSAAEGGRTVAAADLLDPGSRAAREVGTLLHAWIEHFGWPAEAPSESQFLEVAREYPLLAEQHQQLLADFRRMVAAGPIAALLASPAAILPAELVATGLPAGPAEPLLKREQAFALKDGVGMMQGVIDRLVIWQRDGVAVAAEVIDFKFDGVGTAPGSAAGDNARLIAEKTLFYSPQLQAYRAAVAQIYRLDPQHVTARLVFMRSGSIVPVGA